jgi:hypothetical protein
MLRQPPQQPPGEICSLLNIVLHYLQVVPFITICTILMNILYNTLCHTAIENLSDPIGYLLDFTNP